MASKRKKPRVIRYKTPSFCDYCKQGKDPDYKDHETMKKFMTDRAKIMGKDRTGFCARHQRYLSREIKRARHLGLLPHTS